MGAKINYNRIRYSSGQIFDEQTGENGIRPIQITFGNAKYSLYNN